MIQTKTTTHLKLQAQRAAQWYNRLTPPSAAVVAIGVLILSATIASIGRLASQPRVLTPAIATQAPIILIATARPAPSPAPIVPTPAAAVNVVSGPTLPRAVVAWSAPENGEPIGALDAGRAYTILARWGSEWIQCDVAGSGAVWIRTSELLDTAAVMDVKPQPTQPPPPPAPPAPAPVVVVIEAAPTPAPAGLDVAPALSQEEERERNIQDRLRGNEVQHAP